MKDSQLRSAAWMLGWCATFTCAMAMAKHVGGAIGVATLVFVRLLFGLFFATPLWWKRHHRLKRPQQLGLYVISGLSGCLARLSTYYAYGRLPLALATSIGYTMPLMVALLSAIVLRKRITATQWLWLSLGYVGVLVMVQPGEVVWNLALGAAFLANFLASLGTLMVKQLSKTESTESQLLYRGLLNTLFVGVLAAWQWTPLSLQDLGYLSVVGMFGVASQYCRLKAISLGEPYIVTSVSYAKLLMAVPLGAIFFDEVPTYWLWVGTGCILVANYFLVVRKKGRVSRLD